MALALLKARMPTVSELLRRSVEEAASERRLAA
jgi:hypothetical protein